MKNKEDDIILTLRREKENIANMKNYVKLKEKKVEDKGMKISIECRL